MQIKLAQRAETIRVAARGLTEFAEDRATIATMRAIEEAIIAQVNQAEAAQTGEGDAIDIDLEPGQWRVAKDALLLAGRFPRLALTISAALESSQAHAVGPDASLTQAGENGMTPDEKTIDLLEDEFIKGKVIAIAAGGEGPPALLIQGPESSRWAIIKDADLFALTLRLLGPDPLDGRRSVATRADKEGHLDGINVYAGDGIGIAYA